MISVRNRLPLLSGNKQAAFFIVALVLAACSPKLQPAQAPVKKPAENVVKKPETVIAKPAPAAKVASIAMILPFGLDNLKGDAKYSPTGLIQANMAVEYYQGFKLALDSLAAQGYNFKLQVFDSNDNEARTYNLALKAPIRSSDLVVGPVFPDDIKAFTGALTSNNAVLSPLSPANSATINHRNLITVIPPLEYHAWNAAQYISNKVKPKKIFILRSGFSQEMDYVTHFKKAVDSLSKKKIKVLTIVIKRGQLSGLLPQLSKTDHNIFVVPSTDQSFLTVTLRSLDTLSKHYPVEVFGHPNWEKFNFLKAALLQELNTHLTSTDNVNYKAAATINFLHAYRKAYHTEPTEYAIKGFDEGLYFGKQLFNVKSLTELDKTDFTGLHNDFHFIKKTGQGWINTHVNILMYSNFELKQVK